LVLPYMCNRILRLMDTLGLIEVRAQRGAMLAMP